MKTVTAFIKQHPVLMFYALAFAISWGGILILVGGPGGLQGIGIMERFTTLGPVAYLAVLAGPSVAGLLLTGLVSGGAGLRELLSRLLRWRVGARWYAVALLTAPLVTLAVSLALSLIAPQFLPSIFTTDDKGALLLPGIAAGLTVGFLEELGWTGFAIPRLRRRYSVLATGLSVGVLWGAWHFLLFWEGDSFSGTLPLALLLVRLFSWLPAYRMLMVWVYDRTGESLVVAMLMHGSLSATTLTIQSQVTGAAFLISLLVLAAAWWVVVAAVTVGNGRQFSRPPLRKRMA